MIQFIACSEVRDVQPILNSTFTVQSTTHLIFTWNSRVKLKISGNECHTHIVDIDIGDNRTVYNNYLLRKHKLQLVAGYVGEPCGQNASKKLHFKEFFNCVQRHRLLILFTYTKKGCFLNIPKLQHDIYNVDTRMF